MFKNKFHFAFLLLAVLLVGCQARPVKVAEVTIGRQATCAEVADQPAQRARGLSGRTSLAPDRGMLFAFPQSAIQSFWMKEMNFSLDIIWINNNQIVEVWPNAPTPVGNRIPSYQPKNLANYVLEVPAGSLEKYGWQLGDAVKMNFAPVACQN
ncbi:MAG: DUF192 domain-containing protein [Candidatus Parcubacteria bacterium]|nr:DUF192 domain-containing protein [Candidatus Parcubacteria bacterium]